jgi:uncharacterized protein (DUF3084 family)
MRSKFHLVLAATLALGFLGLAHDEFVAFATQNTAHSQDIRRDEEALRKAREDLRKHDEDLRRDREVVRRDEEAIREDRRLIRKSEADLRRDRRKT